MRIARFSVLFWGQSDGLHHLIKMCCVAFKQCDKSLSNVMRIASRVARLSNDLCPLECTSTRYAAHVWWDYRAGAEVGEIILSNYCQYTRDSRRGYKIATTIFGVTSGRFTNVNSRVGTSNGSTTQYFVFQRVFERQFDGHQQMKVG